jgi:hypothetical protein
MALDRKDARTTLDHDVHAQLLMYADKDQVTVAEYIERLVVSDVTTRSRDAIETVERLRSLGIIPTPSEKSGNP